MGIKDKVKLLVSLNKKKKQLIEACDRVLPKIDDEMYMISKGIQNEREKDEAQRVLAIFLIAELIDSFDIKDQKEILKRLQDTMKE